MLSRASTALPRSTSYTGPISKFPGTTHDMKKVANRISSEKLCLVDGRVAFMGGLDMCKSSWCSQQPA